MSLMARFVDERFLAHRQRSTSIAGMVGVVVAVGIFEWRLWVDDVWSWDVLAVALVMVAAKLAVMVWSFWTD